MNSKLIRSITLAEMVRKGFKFRWNKKRQCLEIREFAIWQSIDEYENNCKKAISSYSNALLHQQIKS